MEKKIFKCNKCKDTGKIKFKTIDDLVHYQWIPWEYKNCTCQKIINMNDRKL